MLRFLSIGAILMALLFNPNLIVAQNIISGKITANNSTPLTGANVTIKNTTIGSASDADGNYKLAHLKNGEYLIRVSFFGYETIEKTVVLTGQNLTMDFEMVETSIDLNAVVVTGTRTEKSLLNTPVLTQSISIQELQKKDVTDIAQALEYSVPGIEFSSTAAGKSVSLQGIDAQYMLFMVNGERLAGDTYGDVDYSRINMADIERIEVVKGASSTLYGSNALGGVVNIITKTPVKKLELFASTRFSNYNTQNYQARIGSKLGNFSSQLSVVYDKTDGYDLIEGDSYRTQEKEDGVVLSEHIKYTPSESLLLEANASYLNKNRDNTSADLYDRKNKDFTYGAKATYFLNHKNNLSLSWNSDNYELLNKVTPDSLVSDYDNLYNTARLLGNFNLASWNLLTVGSEYISENLTAERNKIDDKTNTDYILFAQEDIQIGEKANIIGGFRAHNNSQYGWHFTPQFSAMYKIWHLAFRGNYSMGYKTPSLKEKYMSFRIPAPGPPMFLVGFEDLKPETSNYASISTEYTRDGVSFSVSAYRNDIKDMISENMDEYTVKPGGIIEYAYRNYDHVLLKGMDIILKTKIVRNLTFTGATTFSKKTNEITSEEFENARNFSGKGNLDYNLLKQNYMLNINLQGNLYGAKSINLMDETTHQIEKVNLESFSLWRLTTTQTLKSKTYLRLGIDNIFDYTDTSGGYNTGNPGRTFFFGIGLNI
jgi:outer membrane receptor for ferrienterochelin and colicins